MLTYHEGLTLLDKVSTSNFEQCSTVYIAFSKQDNEADGPWIQDCFAAAHQIFSQTVSSLSPCVPRRLRVSTSRAASDVTHQPCKVACAK